MKLIKLISAIPQLGLNIGFVGNTIGVHILGTIIFYISRIRSILYMGPFSLRIISKAYKDEVRIEVFGALDLTTSEKTWCSFRFASYPRPIRMKLELKFLEPLIFPQVKKPGVIYHRIWVYWKGPFGFSEKRKRISKTWSFAEYCTFPVPEGRRACKDVLDTSYNNRTLFWQSDSTISNITPYCTQQPL